MCGVFGHRFWRKEQVSPWGSARVEQPNCVRCGVTASGSMTAVQPEQDTNWITDELLEKSVPCDYYKFGCHKGGPAKWRVRLVPCSGCKRPGGVRVICDDCKEYVLHTEDAAQCYVCDSVFVPFREVFSLITAL